MTSSDPLPGRVAAVDYGRRRIGLAVTDPLRITVRGLETLVHDGELAAAAERVARRLEEEGVRLVVVGLPLHASGDASPMSEEARRFGRALGAADRFEIVFLDEGLTSWDAEEAIRGRGGSVRRAAREGEVDRRAAIALLRSWLQEQERPPPPRNEA